MSDYGPAWRILRHESIMDQIYIKAKRIRTIQEKKKQLVTDSIQSEYIGIINYAIMGLIQLERGTGKPGKKLQLPGDISRMKINRLYNYYALKAKRLFKRKNHDYGEAWREMNHKSFNDLILVKLFRIRQINDNKGRIMISEGPDANLYDIINYAIFALIKCGFREPLKTQIHPADFAD